MLKYIRTNSSFRTLPGITWISKASLKCVIYNMKLLSYSLELCSYRRIDFIPRGRATLFSARCAHPHKYNSHRMTNVPSYRANILSNISGSLDTTDQINLSACYSAVEPKKCLLASCLGGELRAPRDDSQRAAQVIPGAKSALAAEQLREAGMKVSLRAWRLAHFELLACADYWYSQVA